MRAIAYKVTRHTIPGWVPIHDKEPRGIAYETDTHFVHVFGSDRGLWVVSIGLTVTQSKSGTLQEWAERTFGAQDIVALTHPPGHATKGVWRPGLYFDNEIQVALQFSEQDVRLAEQNLLLLIQRLDELLHFIEPTPASLAAYSHKSRELLILACTEVENYWKNFLCLAYSSAPSRGFTTNDYVELKQRLFLAEYAVRMPRYESIGPRLPFEAWSPESPTKSLVWYDAYNKTKHDRTNHFNAATLENCILAVMANVVLFSVRFGPFRLYNGAGTLPAYFNQLLSLELRSCEPTSFYVPLVVLHPNQRRDLVCYNARDSVQRWVGTP
jgi:hypothetical protein